MLFKIFINTNYHRGDGIFNTEQGGCDVLVQPNKADAHFWTQLKPKIFAACTFPVSQCVVSTKEETSVFASGFIVAEAELGPLKSNDKKQPQHSKTQYDIDVDTSFMSKCRSSKFS